MERGSIWWVSLPNPVGPMPGYRRPVVIVQSDAFNRSRISTVIAVVLTSNLRLAAAPGNVLLTARSTDLPRDSVANVSQVITLDKSFLTERVGRLTGRQMQQIDDGLRLALAL